MRELLPNYSLLDEGIDNLAEGLVVLAESVTTGPVPHSSLSQEGGSNFGYT